MENEIKNILCKLIKDLYSGTDESILKSYMNFKIIFSKKKTKMNEKYENRNIYIYNLFRREAELVNSMIIGIAHHIDFCTNGFTNNKAPFFLVYRTILKQALDMSYIDYAELTASEDYKSVKRIRDALENYWKDNILSSSESRIEVYDCYKHKGILKNGGYEFSYTGKYWGKILSNNEIAEELRKVREISSNVHIVSPNKITVNIEAYITVSGNTFLIKNTLKSLGYYYKDRVWKKKINASSYLMERKETEKVIPQGQGIKIDIEY